MSVYSSKVKIIRYYNDGFIPFTLVTQLFTFTVCDIMLQLFNM